jgi:F0F1-type ATP synthase membrane subunit c/vacuolar-type H+-ATPase subunit K
VTWVFFFLYGPVEDALPVYVAHGLHAGAGLLGAYWASFGVGALVSALVTGTLRNHDIRRVTVLIVAGWGACLLPFAFAPARVTLVCFAAGGLIYGPFIPLTYALLQSVARGVNLPWCWPPAAPSLSSPPRSAPSPGARSSGRSAQHEP